MLQRFVDTWGKPDILLVTGDHVGHTFDDYHPKMMIIKETSELVNQYFGDVPVLFQIGNNDTKDHDQAIDTADQA